MRKNYKIVLSLALSVVGISARAQSPITVTQADLPTVGSSWINASDSSGSNLFVTAASANFQTWNYASSFMVYSSDTIILVSPSGLPGASNFPQANLAIAHPSDSASTFLKTDNTGLYFDGLYIAGLASVDISPNELVVPVPFTYNSTRNSTYGYTFNLNYNGIPIKVISHTVKTVVADAFGSLVTPAATYPNTLRLQSHEIKNDTTYINSGLGFQPVDTSSISSTSYMWLRNTSCPILMEIDLDSAGNITGGRYLQQNYVGLKEPATAAKPNAYPNPATDRLTIIASGLDAGKSVLSVYDNLGNLVMQCETESNYPASAFVLPVAHLAQGVYSYQLNNRARIVSGKFVKQ